MFRTFIPALLIHASILSGTTAKAQISHDLTIYSEDGLKFTLVINGEEINSEPKSSVKVENTNNDYANVIVRFEDASIPQIQKKVLQIAEPGTGGKGPVAVVYAIKEKKGEQILRFVSRSAKKIQDAPLIIINNN